MKRLGHMLVAIGLALGLLASVPTGASAGVLQTWQEEDRGLRE